MGWFSRDGDRIVDSDTGQEPDVKVHHTQGCPLCGDTGQHTHAQAEWRALIDDVDPWWQR